MLIPLFYFLPNMNVMMMINLCTLLDLLFPTCSTGTASQKSPLSDECAQRAKVMPATLLKLLVVQDVEQKGKSYAFLSLTKPRSNYHKFIQKYKLALIILPPHFRGLTIEMVFDS